MRNNHSELIGRLLATNQSPIDQSWLIKLAGTKFQQRATPKCQFKTPRNRHAAMLLVISKFYHTELQFTNTNYSCAFPTIDYCAIVSAALPCSLGGGSCSMSGNSAQSPLVISKLLGIKISTDTNLIYLGLVVVFVERPVLHIGELVVWKKLGLFLATARPRIDSTSGNVSWLQISKTQRCTLYVHDHRDVSEKIRHI